MLYAAALTHCIRILVIDVNVLVTMRAGGPIGAALNMTRNARFSTGRRHALSVLNVDVFVADSPRRLTRAAFRTSTQFAWIGRCGSFRVLRLVSVQLDDGSCRVGNLGQRLP